MNKKNIALLLALLSGTVLSLVSCGGESSSVSSAAPTSSVTSDSSEETVKDLEDVVSEDPKVAYVGDVLKIEDYFTFAPNGAKYSVSSSDEKVAKIDGDSINIVGAGEASIAVTGMHAAAKISIKALSKNAKDIKALVDSVKDNYRFDAKSETHVDTTEESEIDTDYNQTYYIVKNPKYCYDGYWTWEGNSYYKLAKLKDKQGNERSYQFVLDDVNSHDSDALTFTRRNYVPAYEEKCFYMDGEVMMPSAKFEDDGEGVSTTDWKTMADFYCSLGGGYTYSGSWKLPGIYKYQKLTFTKITDESGTTSLHFQLNIICDWRDDDVTLTVMSGDFTKIGNAKIPLLESYIASGETPCSSDITPITTALDAFQESGNYKIDYRAGFMLSAENRKWYEGNFWHTGTYDPDNGNYDYSMLDTEGSIDRTNQAVFEVQHDEQEIPAVYKYGYYADEEGLRFLSIDEETGKIKKGSVYNDEITSLNSLLYYNANVFEDELIREVDPLPIGDNKYQLDGKLDDGYTSAYIDCLAGNQEIYGYLSYSYWSGYYTTATMELKDGEIDFFAYVRYEDYIYGVEVKMYGIGTASVDVA